MASPPDRELVRWNSPGDFGSVSPEDVPEDPPPSAATSSTSGEASQPSSEVASSTSGSLELSDDDASISDCGDLILSALSLGEGAESDDDSGYLGDLATPSLSSSLYAAQEPLSLLAAEYESGNIIELFQDKYSRFRRAKGDENCFYRSFMFAYLEHLLETQDKAKIDSAFEKVRQCTNTLKFGDPDYIVEDYFSVFSFLLNGIQRGKLSHEELLRRSNNRYVSNYFVLFLKIVASGELRAKAEFYEPFVAGFEKLKLEKFCKSSVELMGESDQVQAKALTDALGVQLRIEYVVQSSNHSINPQLQHHDFQPSASSSTAAADRLPSITLLYRPGRYYILYP